MRGALLPATIALGLLAMLAGFVPPRPRAWALLAAVAAALLVAALATPLASHPEAAFACCWILVIALALAMHLPPARRVVIAIPAGIAAGIAAGAVIAAEGRPSDVARASAALLLVLPAAWIVRRGWGIALKVAGSWAIAVAVLSALLPVSTPTPGYVADHME